MNHIIIHSESTLVGALLRTFILWFIFTFIDLLDEKTSLTYLIILEIILNLIVFHFYYKKKCLRIYNGYLEFVEKKGLSNKFKQLSYFEINTFKKVVVQENDENLFDIVVIGENNTSFKANKHSFSWSGKAKEEAIELEEKIISHKLNFCKS